MTFRADIYYSNGGEEKIYFKRHEEDEREYNFMDCLHWAGGNTPFDKFAAVRINKRHVKCIRFIENASMTEYTYTRYPEIRVYFGDDDTEAPVDYVGDISI